MGSPLSRRYNLLFVSLNTYPVANRALARATHLFLVRRQQLYDRLRLLRRRERRRGVDMQRMWHFCRELCCP
jgi:hypothetical protein